MSSYFETRVQERMNALLEDKELIISKRFFDLDDDVLLDDLLHKEVMYKKEMQDTALSSIVDMCTDFIDCMKNIPQIKQKVVHGDFHAPNIARTSNNDVRIIDISDVRFNEDPTWDLGKWLNYFKRFYIFPVDIKSLTRNGPAAFINKGNRGEDR